PPNRGAGRRCAQAVWKLPVAARPADYLRLVPLEPAYLIAPPGARLLAVPARAELHRVDLHRCPPVESATSCSFVVNERVLTLIRASTSASEMPCCRSAPAPLRTNW